MKCMMERLNNSYYKLTSLFHQDGKGSVSCCTSLSTLTVESHPSFMSIFYFIYWAQKYTVTIHLNENHLVVIIMLHRKPLHLTNMYNYGMGLCSKSVSKQ